MKRLLLYAIFGILVLCSFFVVVTVCKANGVSELIGMYIWLAVLLLLGFQFARRRLRGRGGRGAHVAHGHAAD